MIKKIITIITAIIFIGIAGQSFGVNQKKRKSQVGIQLERLLLEHQKFINAVYTTDASGNTSSRGSLRNASLTYEKDFFLFTNFLNDGPIQNFLKNVENDINRSGKTGYTMMSFTNFVSINGQKRSIQYTYQSNGRDIILVKQSNENGNLLKSVYYYDIDTQSLKAEDFKENNIIHEKVYKI